jgi:hypothetical protein
MGELVSEMHVARGWFDLVFEEECPCEKAACGMVIIGRFDLECPYHDLTKTIRQGHSSEFCEDHREH